MHVSVCDVISFLELERGENYYFHPPYNSYVHKGGGFYVKGKLDPLVH